MEGEPCFYPLTRALVQCHIISIGFELKASSHMNVSLYRGVCVYLSVRVISFVKRHAPLL